MRASKARAGRRTGKACPRRWIAYGKLQGTGRRSGSPRSSTISASDMLRTAFFALKREAAPGVDGLTWRVYEADLDRRIEDLHARVHRGAYRALPSRRRYIPKADGTPAPAGGRRPRGQDRPEGDGRGAERDLRGGFPRILVWVPAAAQPARCAGRAGGRDHQQEGELTSWTPIRPELLRLGQPVLAGPLPGAPDRRPAHHPPDPEMAQGGCPGRRDRDGQRDGDRAGVGDIAAARQRLPALRASISGPSAGDGARPRAT